MAKQVTGGKRKAMVFPPKRGGKWRFLPAKKEKKMAARSRVSARVARFSPNCVSFLDFSYLEAHPHLLFMFFLVFLLTFFRVNNDQVNMVLSSVETSGLDFVLREKKNRDNERKTIQIFSYFFSFPLRLKVEKCLSFYSSLLSIF